MSRIAMLHPLFELIYLSSIATLALTSGAIYMGCNVDVLLLITFAGIVFGIYTLNRFTDKEDIVNAPEKRLFFNKYSYFLILSIIVLLASVIALILNHKLTVYHLVVIYCGIAYSVKVVPYITKKFRISFTRLKEIPFMKSLTVSILLGTAFFAINWSVYPAVAVRIGDLILLMISFILGVFMNTNFADCRDMVGDKVTGIPTIPVLFGKRKTYLYTMIVPGMIWTAIVIGLMLKNTIGLPLGFFFLANLLYTLLYVCTWEFNLLSNKRISFISDACVAVYAVGLLAIHYLG